LKAQEPEPDTTSKDTVKTDSTQQDSSKIDSVKTDSTAQDSTIAIRSLPRLQAVEPQQPKLYYDQKEQALFVRFKKNGREFRYRVTGSKN
jgi:hypothetical protein